MDPAISRIVTTLIWFAFVASTIVAIMSLLVALQRKSGRRVGGWHYLTPGPVVWVALVASFLFGGLLSCIYLFVGSARADAAQQMQMLEILAVGFNLATLAIAYMVLAEEVRWNDKGLERRTLLFRRRSITWSQLAALGYEAGTGYWWVSAYQSPRIRFSPFSNGFVDLMRKILEKLPTDHTPTADVASIEAMLVPVRAPAQSAR